jgi:hypothetical protein
VTNRDGGSGTTPTPLTHHTEKEQYLENYREVVMSAVTWHELTRSELTTFDRDATDLVLQAMKYGAMGRMSSKGHAIIRNARGQTMSIARKMSKVNRTHQNTLSQFRKLFGPEIEADNRPDVREAAQEAKAADALADAVPHSDEMYPCPIEGCPHHEPEGAFVTPGALYTHTRKDHEVCLECVPPKVFSNHQRLVAHHRMAHTEEGAATIAAGRNAQKKAGMRIGRPKGSYMLDYEPWRAENPRNEDKPYECPGCLAQYDRRQFGNHRIKCADHFANPEGVATKWPWVCPVCGSQRRDARDAAVHARSHNSAAGKAAAQEVDMTNEPVETTTVVREIIEHADDEFVLGTIASLIPSRLYPPDERVKALQEEVATLTKERDDLQARLDLMREALGA